MLALFSIVALAALQGTHALPVLRPGEMVTGEIAEGDPAIHTRSLDSEFEGTTLGRAFRFEIEQPGPHFVELRSHAFDAYLVLRNAEGVVLAENDDGPINLNSLLVCSELLPGVAYEIEACALRSGHGKFELEAVQGRPSQMSPLELGEARRRDFEGRLAFVETTHGPRSAEMADALDAWGENLRESGRFGEARPIHERALAIREDLFGPDDPTTAISLNNLGLVHRGLGDLTTSRRLTERALAIRERVLGPDHLTTALSLSNLADVLGALGAYDLALSAGKRAVAIREQALGPDHPDTAIAINNLAHIHRFLGEYEHALVLLERALAVWEKVLGPDHPNTGLGLSNVAELHEALGEYDTARPKMERALSILEKSLGPEHPLTLTCLNNLAALLGFQGDYDSARRLHESALEIRERILPPDHPDIAEACHNLAIAYLELGDYAAAVPYAERAVAIYGKVLGADHPSTARSLNVLGAGLTSSGKPAEARAHFERALKINEQSLSPGHPATALSMHNLASVLEAGGDHQRALELLERALAIDEEVYGAGTPACSEAVAALSMLLLGIGKPEAAWMHLERQRVDRRRYFERTLASLTEAERFLYVLENRRVLDIELAVAAALGTPQASMEAYDGVLAWKGLAGRTMLASRERLASTLTPEQRLLVEHLRALQARLSSLALRTDPGRRESQGALIGELRGERNRIELELQRSMDSSGAPARAGFSELRSSLPPRCAVVDFFLHRVPEWKLRDAQGLPGPRTWSEPRLSVWITRPGAETVTRLDLGRVSGIETAVRDHLMALDTARGISVAAARGVSAVTGSAEASSASNRLRELLWDPISPYVADVDTVLVSPDGFLGNLSFETVTGTDGRFLLERHGFVYTPDLASLPSMMSGERSGQAYESLLCCGGLDFDERLEEDASVEADLHSVALRGGFHRHWPSLPQTAAESREIAEMHAALPENAETLLLQGCAATERRLKLELPRHSLLHLATHGFFLPGKRPPGIDRNLETAQLEEHEHLVAYLPGLLSGLVCSGANAPPVEEDEDGYLTAEELQWLDLSQVELVVLSACETGLGDVRAGEGLVGLSRACRIAGARTVVSSLWTVSDDSTARLMRMFYTNLWSRGMGKLEALRSAQLEMLADNMERCGAPLPTTWGAFVLSGDWR